MKDKLTFGQKAVGLTSNPSGEEAVIKVKQLSAEILDILERESASRKRTDDPALSWIASTLRVSAFNSVIAAQMATVKFITWKDNP